MRKVNIMRMKEEKERKVVTVYMFPEDNQCLYQIKKRFYICEIYYRG